MSNQRVKKEACGPRLWKSSVALLLLAVTLSACGGTSHISVPTNPTQPDINSAEMYLMVAQDIYHLKGTEIQRMHNEQKYTENAVSALLTVCPTVPALCTSKDNKAYFKTDKVDVGMFRIGLDTRSYRDFQNDVGGWSSACPGGDFLNILGGLYQNDTKIMMQKDNNYVKVNYLCIPQK